MSFYSYKNANAQASPGSTGSGVLNGLNQRVCIQVKNVYDSALSQKQLDDEAIVVGNIVPVLPSGCSGTSNRPCDCTCKDNVCNCTCPGCGTTISHEEAVENAENSPCPLPQPVGTWTFVSCRSSTTKGKISNLSIERLCDRPQFARVKCTVAVPIDVLFTDQRCQEWIGQATVNVDRDILLCIPEDSIIPFTLESLVSAICVSGSYIGSCTFQITLCVSIVLKVLAEVDIMVPTYGFCQIPPAEEFAESVCDEFFSLPLFPQSSCAFETIGGAAAATAANGTSSMFNGTSYACPSSAADPTICTCSSCGTTCANGGSICPRCGSAMTGIS